MSLSRLVLLHSLLLWLCMLQQVTTQDISILPDAEDVNLFIGQRFQRTCMYLSTPASLQALQWLKDGQIVQTVMEHELPFVLLEVSLQDAGAYSCQAVLSDDSTVGPVSAGNLNVLDPAEYIDAPPVQFALIDRNVTLECAAREPHRASVVWLPEGGTPIDPRLTNVSLEDDGQYTCSTLFLDTLSGAFYDSSVELRVLVPPRVTSFPPVHQEASRNSRLVLTVNFQSRFSDDTTVSWYKDGVSLPDDAAQTDLQAEPDAMTRLVYETVRHDDGGRYAVVVKNDHSVIPEELRMAEVTFNVTVIVLPVAPTNVAVVTASTPNKVEVTWTLNPGMPDERPDSLTLTLQSDQSVAEEYLLPGNQTHFCLGVVPGMQYQVLISTHNRAGISTAVPFDFETDPADPVVSSLNVVRINTTTFDLSLSLNYTGGGNITQFTVTFRILGTTEWKPTGSATPFQSSSGLVWRRLVQLEAVSDTDIVEFRVALRNEDGLGTLEVVQEQLYLPGAPTDLSLNSSTETSLILSVTLSLIGTSPILQVVIDLTPLTSSQPPATHNTSGAFLPGETVQVGALGLEKGTEYRVSAYAVNRAGRGPSIEESFTTVSPDDSSSFPVTVVIITAAVGGTLALVVIVVILVCVLHYCCRRRTEKNIYYPRSTSYISEEKKLDANHEMVNRLGSKSFAIHSGSLTPRSPTTAASSHDGRFPFENSSSDSDGSVSEVPSYARYSYRVSSSPAPPAQQAMHTSIHSMPNMQSPPIVNSSAFESLLSPPPHTPSFATNV